MKRLALMRHGEAMPYESELSDLERPLTRRGAADAALVAERCRHEYWQPDLIVASAARRTLETALAAARVFGLEKHAITTDPRLYQADDAIWTEIVRQLPARSEAVLLVGHNPGISQFAKKLLPLQHVHDFSPATVVALRLDTDSWDRSADAVAEAHFRIHPR